VLGADPAAHAQSSLAPTGIEDMAGFICEVSMAGDSFFLTFFVVALLAGASNLGGLVVFRWLYMKPTYEQWRWKTTPTFPKPDKVRAEILQSFKGILMSALPPALSIYFANAYPGTKLSRGYCGVEPHGWAYLIISTLVALVASDFYEFFYHWCGHMFPFMWAEHKKHHVFPNPTPFAVVADEPIDQFMRALPLLVFPMFAPLNMDATLAVWFIMFYSWGVYMHSGFEVPWIDSHSPIINGAYQHHVHHCLAVPYKAYHCGFFVKIWDNLFGSVYKGECFCAKCSQAKGKRSREEWDKIEKPDYAILWNPRYFFGFIDSEGKPKKA